MSMEYLIDNIISYLKYLNGDCGLHVSVHFNKDIFDRMPRDVVSMLLPYNSHTNAYCIMAKSIDHRKCILNQRELLAECRRGKPFCHTCHAGVYEYIYPICKDDCAVGFAAVSGYRPKSIEEESLINRDLWENVLDTELPVNLCGAVIPPLCIMTEQLLSVCLRERSDEYHLILQYLNEYHTNITLSDLTKYFSRSRSHISHLFKKESGMTIRAYCNSLRLKDAEKLLLSTDRPITEIALDVGFNDASYFIYLFKKKFGMPPQRYRRKNQNLSS